MNLPSWEGFTALKSDIQHPQLKYLSLVPEGNTQLLQLQDMLWLLQLFCTLIILQCEEQTEKKKLEELSVLFFFS